MLVARVNTVSVARPTASRRVAAVRPVVRMSAASPLDKAVTDALKTAEAECDKKGVQSKDCEVAWDQAEELLAAKAHKKANEENDPLEAFCKDAPDADECRVYED